MNEKRRRKENTNVDVRRKKRKNEITEKNQIMQKTKRRDSCEIKEDEGK